jgi:hypothetical protein
MIYLDRSHLEDSLKLVNEMSLKAIADGDTNTVIGLGNIKSYLNFLNSITICEVNLEAFEQAEKEAVVERLNRCFKL